MRELFKCFIPLLTLGLLVLTVIYSINVSSWASQVALVVKNLLAHAEDLRGWGLIPASGDPLEEGMAAYSSILAWRIPWTQEPSGLQSMGSQRVGYN